MEKETANEREVFAISRDQVALWSLNKGMTMCLEVAAKLKGAVDVEGRRTVT